MDETERNANEQAVFEVVEAAQGAGMPELLEAMTEALHKNFPQYTGIYIYMVEGDMLVLRHFRGRATEHVRIPIGEGICGRAARVKATVTVNDVSSDADYIACSLETRSEIVVPIVRSGTVLGEIDIDSDVPAAFGPQDKAFLEELARRIASTL